MRKWTPVTLPAAVQPGHDAGDNEHILKLPATGLVELPWKHIPAPIVDRSRGLSEIVCVPTDTGSTPHQALQRVADVGQIERFVLSLDRGILNGDYFKRLFSSSQRSLRGSTPRMGTVDQSLE